MKFNLIFVPVLFSIAAEAIPVKEILALPVGKIVDLPDGWVNSIAE